MRIMKSGLSRTSVCVVKNMRGNLRVHEGVSVYYDTSKVGRGIHFYLI